MLGALLLSTAFAAHPRCGLPMRGLSAPPTASPAPRATLDDRDPYSLPNQLSTAHFTAHWGDTGNVLSAEIAAVLAAFETSWDVEITEMAHPAPAGTNAYRFNIYIGDTGDGAPSGYGAGGYYDVDREGYPMVVVARDTLEDLDFAEITAAHEFYHALQDTLATYAYSGVGAWYWESTAVWMSGEVFPDNADYAVFLMGYAFLPYLPVGYFDYPDTGALAEYHQYGAFIFERYLSEQVSGWQIIRDSWVRGDDPDPLVVLADLLAADGTDLPSTFTAFAAHNTVWDYADQAFYEADLLNYEAMFAADDARVVATLPSGGTADWTAPPDATLPQRYGYNVLQMRSPAAGTLRIDLAGDALGSAGSAASFGATVVVERGAEVEYEPIPLVDGSGTLDLDLDGDEAALFVAVAAWSDALVDGETFGYRYRVERLEDTGEDTGDASGGGGSLPDKSVACGCAAGDRSLAVWMAGFAAALVARRRRLSAT